MPSKILFLLLLFSTLLGPNIAQDGGFKINLLSKGHYSLPSFIQHKGQGFILAYDLGTKSIVLFDESGKKHTTHYLGKERIDGLEYSSENGRVFVLVESEYAIFEVDLIKGTLLKNSLRIKDDWYCSYSKAYQDFFKTPWNVVIPKFADNKELKIHASITNDASECQKFAQNRHDSIFCLKGYDLYELNFHENNQGLFFPYFNVIYKIDTSANYQKAGIDTMWVVGTGCIPSSKIHYFNNSTGDLIYEYYTGFTYTLSYKNLNTGKMIHLNDIDLNIEKSRGYQHRFSEDSNKLETIFITSKGIHRMEYYINEIPLKID